MIHCLFLLGYDSWVFAINTQNCKRLIQNAYIDDVVWFISRSFQYYIWCFPIIYVFWTPLIIQQQRTSSSSSTANKRMSQEIAKESIASKKTMKFDANINGSYQGLESILDHRSSIISFDGEDEDDID